MQATLMEETIEKAEGFRLAPQQERVWTLQHDSRTFRSQCAILLEGSLEIRRLKEAFRRLVDNYEILRTTFHPGSTAQSVMQVIAVENAPDWRDIDLESQSPEQQDQRIVELFQEEGKAEFDLEHGPLVKICLARLSSSKHFLLLNLPALCADTRTLENITCQLGRYYSAALNDQLLSEEILQYADLADWQHELIDSPTTDLSRPWLREENALSNLKLPFEKTSETESTFDPDLLTHTLDAVTFASLEQLAQRYDVPISVLLLACWQVLLWRLTGEPDIVVAGAFDGRNYTELEEALGLFVRHLPLHVCLQERARLSEIVRRVNEKMTEAEETQEFFSWEEYESKHDRAHLPAIGFSYAQRMEKQCESGLSFSIQRQYSCVERFKIKLDCLRAETSLSLCFQFDKQLLERAEVERISEQYLRLIESLLVEPEGEIGRLEIMNEAELHRVLVDANDTKKDYPNRKCVQELFESQPGQTPAAVAVVYQGKEIDYSELNRRANQLAHYLRTLGVGPDILVGICLERSIEMVIGLLGILKAGGAYLPLDPSHPRERLSFMIEDARLTVLLTEEKLLALLPESASGVVVLDSQQEQEKIDRCSIENPVTIGTATNLAYVIYTSGSTGKPKGVMITHQGLVNYLSWCTGAYHAAEGNGSPVHSPLGFDLTVTSLFSPLISGRSVTLVPEQPGIEMLGATLNEREDFSLIKLTPAHLDALELYLEPAQAAGKARALIIGGEALSAATISFWQQHAPSTRLINEYGPTETVVGCCVYEVPGNSPMVGSVPIGTPIANTQLFLLSPSLMPVPVGVTGELYIGGHGLARGYLNRPNLTAEQFIPNPFSAKPGARLYRSGDLARYRADGNIEYLGRVDRQVKILGYRIELGEIETVLAQHKALRECVVVAREDTPGEKRLVAYIVVREGAITSISDLQEYMSERLPEYMAPASYVLLDKLPLTRNGKVDVRALPPPAQLGSELRESFVPPRDTLELQLMELWQDILKLPRIGVTESFFDVGGNSLLAVRLMAQIDRMFEQSLPLSVLFENRTIEKLAQLLRQNKGGMIWSPLVEIQPHGSKRPLFFVHPSGGGVLGYIHLSRRLGVEQPFYGFQSPGLYGEESFTTIEEMAAQYVEALRIKQPEGPYLLGGWSMGGTIAFEMAQQLLMQDQEVALLALLDTRVPIYDRNREEKEQAQILSNLAEALTSFLGKTIGPVYDELQSVEPEKQLGYLLEQMIKAHVVSPGTGLMHMKRFVEVYTGNTKATMNYEAKPYAQPITIFRAAELDPECLADDPVTWEDPALGWHRFATGTIDVRMLPTAHDRMIFEPNVASLADSLAACLDEINGSQGAPAKA
jgi:amino acid adenylation domain-containing protein